MNTQASIEQIIRDNINRENRSHQIHNFVKAQLAKWEGKKLTKRVATQIEGALGAGARVSLEPPGMFSGKITIYGIAGFETYEKRIYFFLHGSEYSAAEFERQNTSTGSSAVTRNQRRYVHLHALGAVQRAAKAVDAFLAARTELNAALENIEDDNSEIERFFKTRI